MFGAGVGSLRRYGCRRSLRDKTGSSLAWGCLGARGRPGLDSGRSGTRRPPAYRPRVAGRKLCVALTRDSEGRNSPPTRKARSHLRRYVGRRDREFDL